MLKRASRLSKIKQSRLRDSFISDLCADDAAYFTKINRNTANLWYRHYRELIKKYYQPVLPFSGEIEIDHAYFGGRQRRGGLKGTHAWSKNKTIVLGFYCRDLDGGTLYLTIVPNAKTSVLLPIIKRVVQEGSTIYTDGWRGFACLKNEGYSHYATNHKAGYYADKKGEGSVHTGHIEAFWGQAKHHYLKFNGIPQKTILIFLKERELRYNLRSKKGYGSSGPTMVDILKEFQEKHKKGDNDVSF